MAANTVFQSEVEKAFGAGYSLGTFHRNPSHQGKIKLYLSSSQICFNCLSQWCIKMLDFFLLQNDAVPCTTSYWVLFSLQVILIWWRHGEIYTVFDSVIEASSCFIFQFPIAILVFGYEATKLYKEHKRRMSTGNAETVCGASIQWSPLNIAFCALCGILGGTVGGLLGSGGGFILGPLLLEIGVIPQVYSTPHPIFLSFPPIPMIFLV